MTKKIIIVLCFLFISKIFSQSSSNFTIPVLISVSNSLIINKVSGDMDFGEVLSTTGSQILTKSPEDGVLFEVTGISRAEISIDYSTNIVLDNSDWITNYGGENGDLTFIPNVRHTRKNPTYTNSRNLRDGRIIKLKNDSGIGKLFIWLGGELTVNPNQEAGDYKGTFNITVAY